MRLIRNYFWWTYERGSFHYDVMVTVILLFLFIAPHYINFGDKPQPSPTPRKNEIRAWQQDGSHFGYEVPLAMLHDTTTDTSIRGSLHDSLTPFVADPQIDRYTAVFDESGHVIAYDTVIRR